MGDVTLNRAKKIRRIKEEEKVDIEKEKCWLCDSYFSTKSNLRRHMRDKHKEIITDKPEKRCSRLKCPQKDCDVVMDRYAGLRQHLLDEHGVHCELVKHKFLSNADFLQWKTTYEQQELASYCLETSAKALGKKCRRYYVCHRSYEAKLKGTGKRKQKSLGTNKFGRACPSTMSVTTEPDGTVGVDIWTTHVGHMREIGRILLSEEDKNKIAGKLAEGVPMEKILDEVREEYEGTEFRRLHLLTRRDLHNICRDFHITYTEKRQEDNGNSVKLWVEEMRLLQDAFPLLYFKEQGVKDSESALHSEDFVLIIMTQIQKEQLIKFGNETVCIHGTYDTNEDDFQLYTLFTVDENGNGCPVAFCISNRSDEVLFKVFFSNIQRHAGTVRPTVFMSDDSPAFYNAWSSIMCSVPHHFFCAWDVDRNWRQQLARISVSVEKKALIHRKLRVLMGECVVDKFFKQLLPQVLQDLYADAATHKFGQYFDNYYAKRPQEWAYCFRQHLGLNSDMYLEPLRKQLKHVCREGKKTQRLDKTIHALLKLARDKMFTRMVKLARNISSDRVLKIEESHERSQKIPTSFINHVEGSDEWIVQSSSNVNATYVVQKVSDSCEVTNCSFRCDKCNVCVHMFKCSCVDSVIRFNICKHIHACATMCFPNTVTHEEIVLEEIVIQDVTELENDWEESESGEYMRCDSSVIRSKIEAMTALNEATTFSDEGYTLIVKQLDDVINVMLKTAKQVTNVNPVVSITKE